MQSHSYPALHRAVRQMSAMPRKSLVGIKMEKSFPVSFGRGISLKVGLRTDTFRESVAEGACVQTHVQLQPELGGRTERLSSSGHWVMGQRCLASRLLISSASGASGAVHARLSWVSVLICAFSFRTLRVGMSRRTRCLCVRRNSTKVLGSRRT